MLLFCISVVHFMFIILILYRTHLHSDDKVQKRELKILEVIFIYLYSLQTSQTFFFPLSGFPLDKAAWKTTLQFQVISWRCKALT